MFRLLLLFTTFVASIHSGSALTIWPKPQFQEDSGDLFALDVQSFQFDTESDSEVLKNAFKRYRGIIFLHSPAFPGSSIPDNIEGVLSTATVRVVSSDETLTLETDESYNLTVSKNGVEIDAQTVYGALNGIETFSQIVDRGTFVNGTQVSDYPRFQFRATMIDTSRHYYPVPVILQHLDAMAYAKFNVLHWHIVDSISFPYQSSKFPEMSRSGAYSPDHVYTSDDIEEIVTYAMLRGIRVIPEFDTPGHVRSGYDALDPPILTTCYDDDKKPVVGDGATGPLDPTLNATYDFLDALYSEIRDVFPDKYVHVGGDEVPSDCWASNPDIVAYMKAHNLDSFADLETLFEQRLLNILKQHNTSYICWQEIFDNGAKIEPDTVIDVWKGGNWQDEMASVTAAGYHSVLSAPFYLNYISYGEDWPKYYTVEPSNFTGGEAAESSGLLGGVEVCMWSEFVDASNFISREWPRAASVGERGWSSKSVTDVDDARRRLHEFRCKLLARGIGAEPITNGGNRDELSNNNFCPMEWIPKYSPPWN
eukprot:g2861.t1